MHASVPLANLCRHRYLLIFNQRHTSTWGNFISPVLLKPALMIIFHNFQSAVKCNVKGGGGTQLVVLVGKAELTGRRILDLNSSA